MNKIYQIISQLTDNFTEICFGITNDKNIIDDAVQELMLYFMQMNQQNLKSIYEKDGEKGLLKYGAVVLKRSLTSPRSPFYYKYKKYYTHININYTTNNTFNNLQNLPEKIERNYSQEKLEQIDKVLDNVYWYDKKIFELYYYESNTLDSLSKKTGISRNSIFNTIDKVRQHIKEKINE
jgi:RNA polymerase sigma factor (sigma-70 family)|tara:strand:+ start:2317 stop:2853 length:537 start_codon:yes stop_codon:yes gene_type:complete